MGTDEKKKKTIGEQYQEGWNAYADSVNQTAADMAAQQKAADEAYLQSMAVAEQQRQQTAEQNYNRVADLLKQGYSAQEAMLRASQANVQKAEVEDAVKYKADLNAAKYTGLTELASSVANMIGVGSFNAANQQYRQYSQDWMRKADQDMRLRRARIDNLRERQRAMQNRLDQLRQSNNLTLLQQQAAEDAARNKYATDRANVQRESALAQAKIIAGANNDAAQARLKGQTAAVEANEQQRQFNAKMGQDATLQRERMEQTYRLHGFTKNEKGEWVAPDVSASGSGGSGKGSGGNRYDVTIDGTNVVLNIPKETYSRALLDGKAELRDDLVKITGANSWEELKNGTGRRGAYSEYADIINALSKTGDNEADNDVIDRFVQDHRAEVNEFNKHLFRVSSGSINYGPRNTAKSGVLKSETEDNDNTGWDAGGNTGWNAGGVTSANAFMQGIHQQAAAKKK